MIAHKHKKAILDVTPLMNVHTVNTDLLSLSIVHSGVYGEYILVLFEFRVRGTKSRSGLLGNIVSSSFVASFVVSLVDMASFPGYNEPKCEHRAHHAYEPRLKTASAIMER